MLVIPWDFEGMYFSVAVALLPATFLFASSFLENAMGVDRIESTVSKSIF